MSDITLTQLDAETHDQLTPELSQILFECVSAGASVNFIQPFPPEAALAYWQQKVVPPVRDGGRLIWVAKDEDGLLGTVQLDIDLPPNQPHRGEVTKLLVRPSARRRGVGQLLMQRLHEDGAALGKSLFTLDTRAGDHAEPLYRKVGYQPVGEIPGFALDPDKKALDATLIMYKQL